MVVDTGDSCHSLYELVIMLTATEKQAITIATQIALRGLVLDVEMWTRPWIVELSKKSQIIAEAIFGGNNLIIFSVSFGKSWFQARLSQN